MSLRTRTGGSSGGSIAALLIVAQLAACSGRVEMVVPVDQIGPVWVDPKVELPDGVSVGRDSSGFALMGVLGLVMMVASESAARTEEGTLAGQMTDLESLVYERFINALSRPGVVELSESADAEGHIRLRLQRINFGDASTPSFSVELSAQLSNAGGAVLWRETRTSGAFAPDEASLEDFAYDPAFRTAALVCVLDDAIRQILATIADDVVAQGMHCADALRIVRLKRRAERDRLDQVVTDTTGALLMTCGSPFPLEQDCSFWTGPQREIQLGTQPLRIAGSADGDVVLVHSFNPASAALSNRATSAARAAAFAVLEYLEAEEMEILGVTKIESSGSTLGYFFEVGGDGYSLLKRHTMPAGDE